MTIEQADNQAKELIRIIRESNIKTIKLGEMNIINVKKFVDTHECRMDFLETFSKHWKLNYLRVYLLKKKITND